MNCRNGSVSSVSLSGAQSATRLYVARIMAEYLRRLVDTELDELMLELPAIVLEGPKGVGKTATAERRARTIVRLDDPAHRAIRHIGRSLRLIRAGRIRLAYCRVLP